MSPADNLRLYRVTDVQPGAGMAGHIELSGAIDPFSKLAESAVLAQALQALVDSAKLKLHVDNQRDLDGGWGGEWGG